MMFGMSLGLGGCETDKMVRDISALKNSKSAKDYRSSRNIDVTLRSSLQANTATLKRTNSCQRCYLKETYLRGDNLEGADLNGASLQHANLHTANLQGANLKQASLQGAGLFKTNLQGANLQSADLYGADLRGAKLQGADLRGAKLQVANLQGANLREAKLDTAGLALAKVGGALGLEIFQVVEKSPSSSSDRIEKKRKAEESKIARATPKKSQPPKSTRPKGGSGFFISKSGQVITNAHVVNGCKRITVGDSATKQSPAQLVATDRRNDLALLTLSSLDMASTQTKALIKKLGIKVIPLASEGLLRSDDTLLGERVLVAGFPYGVTVSNAIKVSTGIVSSTVGMGDDTGQFQIDAAVQPGNSGGPIYDERGNIVGVVVAQLNKFIMAKATGSLPENVNFGIKASTVRQFLNAKGVPTKWSKKSKPMSTQQLAKIAEKQTLMVMCHQ